MFNKYSVHNLPEYAYERQYIVARAVDGELWFWGAWDDREKAVAAADDIDGYICE